MTSEPMRDPVSDPLLTAQNSALLVIDYQPSQIQVITSIDHDLLIRNIVSVARLAKTYGLPIVLSTVGVTANGQPPTIPELRGLLSDSVEYDPTQINSWEDTDFRQAVKPSSRRGNGTEEVDHGGAGRRCVWASQLWTPCARTTRSSRSSMPLAALPRRHTERGWSALDGRAHSPSAGYRSLANYNATGLGRRPFPKLSKSFSLLDFARSSDQFQDVTLGCSMQRRNTPDPWLTQLRVPYRPLERPTVVLSPLSGH